MGGLNLGLNLGSAFGVGTQHANETRFGSGIEFAVKCRFGGAMPKQNSGICTIHGALHINFSVKHNSQMLICLAPGMLLNFILDLEFNLL